MPEVLHCHRTACQMELKPGRHIYYRIWNEPSTNTPNVYCVKCGRKITEYNPTLKYEVKL